MIYFIFLLSIIFHEFGHIFVAKIFKIKIQKIRFNIIGFSAEFEEIQNNNIKKSIILLTGPMINLIISILFLNVSNYLYKWEIIYTNFLLFVFNIFPIIPLDGGRILFYILNLEFNLENSFRIMNFISKMFLSFLTIGYAIMIFIIKNVEICFVIIYLWYLNIKEEVNFKWYIKINKNIRKHLNS